MDVLQHTPNPFGGVVVDPQALPELEDFDRLLAASLKAWREGGVKVVWLEVPVQKSALIPRAVEAGFVFHHSSEAYLMLTCRLVEGALIPPFATHYIGAGGVVLNGRDELLVVCERHRRSQTPYYKLPGGALHPGEHLVDGVIREIREETGVRTRFDYLVCFRHWHGYRYGKSDIYFVSRLTPLNDDLAMQESEIEECLWMPVQDYLSSDLVGVFNKHIVRAALKGPGSVPTFVEGYSDPAKYEIFMPLGLGPRPPEV